MILSAGVLIRGLLTVALIAASYFLRPSKNIQRGKINQIPIQRSDFGEMIPQCFGTVRLGGNIIWASPLREVENQESAKGLGPKITNFTYFVDLGILLSESPIIDIIRIWADGKVIVDKTGASEINQPNEIVFRLYSGTQTQEPDPLIQNEVDGRLGTGSTPAYRGRSYVVFEDFPLTDFGNRIPNLSFEVVTPSDTIAANLAGVTVTVGETFTQNTADGITVTDWDRGLIYFAHSGAVGEGPNEYSAGAIGSLDIIRKTPLPVNRTASLVPSSGNLMSKEGIPANVRIYDAFTGSILKSESIGLFTFDSYKNYIYNPTKTGFNEVFLGVDLSIGLSETRYTLVDNEIRVITQVTRPTESHRLAAPTASSDGIGYGAFLDASGITLYGVDVQSDVVAFAALPGFDFNTGTGTWQSAGTAIRFGVLANLSIGDFNLALDTGIIPGFPIPELFDSSEPPRLIYDRGSGDVLIAFKTITNNYMARWSPSGGILWVRQIPFLPGRTNAQQARVTGGVFAWMSGQKLCLINVASGGLSSVYNGETDITSIPTDGDTENAIWDEITYAFYRTSDSVPQATGEFEKIKLSSGAAAVSLADIVQDISLENGYEPIEDIDVSELVPISVNGYLISDQTTGRDAIQPLADVYFFDGIESDYKLRFLTRGRAATQTITESDFLRIGDTDKTFQKTRVQEADLPLSVQINAIDSDNDYQIMTQQAKRSGFPQRTVLSDNQQTIDVPVVLTADETKKAAEITLYQRWNERTAFEFKSHFEFLTTDPTDIIDVTFNDGLNLDVRVVEGNSGIDFSTEFKALKQEEGQYVSTSVGGSGNSLQVTIPLVEPSQLFLLDIPLLRDADTPANDVALVYWGGNTTGSYPWNGGLLYESEDLALFTIVGALSAATSWGVLLQTVSAPDSFWRWDLENTITFSPINGEDSFSSDTELNVLNGSNAIAILRANTDREVEIIQYVDAVVNDDESITLSKLLRGRRGTEVFANTGFVSGDKVIFLSSTTLNTYADTISELNDLHYYRLVTQGQAQSEALLETYTPKGRSLKPYAVAQQKAVASGNDILITGVRRTRYNGEWEDGTGTVPLNEDSEEYRLEILDGPSGSIIRTVTSLTTPSYLYQEADILSELGTTPQEITVKWYQISAQVNLGFTAERTLEVQ